MILAYDEGQLPLKYTCCMHIHTHILFYNVTEYMMYIHTHIHTTLYLYIFRVSKMILADDDGSSTQPTGTEVPILAQFSCFTCTISTNTDAPGAIFLLY